MKDDASAIGAALAAELGEADEEGLALAAEVIERELVPGPRGPKGEQGDQGPKGDTGPMPDHRWDDTKLQFERPDGTWGPLVDLKGDAAPAYGGMRAPNPPAAASSGYGYFPGGWA